MTHYTLSIGGKVSTIATRFFFMEVPQQRKPPPIQRQPRPVAPRQIPQVQAMTQSLGFFRWFHFTLLFLFGLFSCLFIIGCAIWRNYRTIFQSGLIGYFHVLTGVLIGLYITSSTTDEFHDPATLAPRERQEALETRRQRREFIVFKRGAPATIVIAFVAIALCSIYLYNLLNIVINVCPSQHYEPHFTNAVSDANQPVVNVYVSYQHTPPGDYYLKQNVLILKYNASSKEIIRKVKTLDPNVEAYNKWMVNNEVINYNSIKSHHTPINETIDEDNLFCIAKKESSIFSFIENELKFTFYDNLKTRLDAKSFRISDKHNVHRMDNEDEEDMDLHLLTRKICRSEYAFLIMVIVFLLLWAILSLFTIAYNIWLLRL